MTAPTVTAYLDQWRRWLPGGDLGGPNGYIEGSNNDTPFGRRFKLNHQPWCLMFAMCNALDASMPFDVWTAGTRYCAAWHAERGLLRPDPAPGALGLLFEGHKPGTGHAITVEAVTRTGWIGIEGNTDVRGGRTGGRVLRLARSMSAVGKGGGFVHRIFSQSAPVPPLAPQEDDMQLVSVDTQVWIAGGPQPVYVGSPKDLGILVAKLGEPVTAKVFLVSHPDGRVFLVGGPEPRYIGDPGELGQLVGKYGSVVELSTELATALTTSGG